MRERFNFAPEIWNHPPSVKRQIVESYQQLQVYRKRHDEIAFSVLQQDLLQRKLESPAFQERSSPTEPNLQSNERNLAAEVSPVPTISSDSGLRHEKDKLLLLKRGLLPVQRMKLVLLGRGLAGKTSLLRALQGESFCENLNRTVYLDLMELDQCELDDWKVMDGVSQFLRSFSTALNRPTVLPSPTTPSPETEVNSVVDELKSDDDNTVFAPTIDKSEAESESDVDEEYVKLLSSIDTTSLNGDAATLSVYDFAGQDEYAALQQIFVTTNAVYIIVFNIKKMFPANSTIPDQSELQLILSWSSTIRLRAPEAKILIVGTQIDGTPFEHNPLPQPYKEKLQSLEQKLPESVLEQLICSKEQPSHSGLLASSKTGKGISNVRKTIDCAVRESIENAEDIPLGWIQFQDELADAIRGKKCRMVYTVDELFNEWILSKGKFGIRSTDELKVVLTYFHTIGVVLYFPENEELLNFVFPDPQGLINILCSIFRWSYDPPGMGEVETTSRKWIQRGMLKKGYWTKSLFTQVLQKKNVPESQHSLIVSLLKEFNLYCELRPDSHEGAEIILPCFLTDVDIESEFKDVYESLKDYELIDLVLSFPESTLPKGLFHQLATGFASNSPPTFLPVINMYTALVTLGDTDTRQMILQESFIHGVICIKLYIKSDIRIEFRYSWMMINSAIESVLSEHWSKKSELKHKLTLKCPKNENVPHGISMMPEIDSKVLDVVRCNYSHNLSVIDAMPYRDFWFKKVDDVLNAATPKIQPQTNQSEKSMVMLSYSWGKKDSTTKLYPDQERVKKIASGLESRGFKVWLDIYYMSGNMIETMKRVIENCAAVVACVSNDYHKENSNAYDEFVYACSMKRDKVIGVKLTPDAKMLGGAYGFKKEFRDLFFDLSTSSDEEFEAEMEKLEKHLQSIPELQNVV